MPGELRLPDELRRELIPLWMRLLDDGSTTFTVVEDLALPHPERIEGFGLSVFISPAFAEAFSASPTPYLAAQIYQRMLAQDGTVLDQQAIRKANSGEGLHLVVLHFGLRNPDMDHPRTASALQIGSAAFFFTHAGYRVESILNEVYGDQPKRFMEAGGFRLHRDFAAAGHEGARDWTPDERPYLFRLEKTSMPPGAVNPLAELFRTPRPSMDFAPSEQRLLIRALLHDSDTAVAEALGISHDAVKKTWRSIFDRVQQRAPFLLPPHQPSVEGRRSQEKRRHLLDYLRTHLEELRPYERRRGNGSDAGSRRATDSRRSS